MTFKQSFTAAGKIVGVVLSNTESYANLGPLLNIKLSNHGARWLGEVDPLNVTIGEVILVRRSLAWITGIILLVSTLIGVSTMGKVSNIVVILIMLVLY